MGKLADRILSRRQIENLIADGKNVIIYDSKVLSVNAWMPYHPGGDKAILHVVGRDATDEINCLHSKEAVQRMQSFVIGRIEGLWDNFKPPIQGGIFRKLGSGNDEASDSTDHELDQPNVPAEISRSPSPSSVSSDDGFLHESGVRHRGHKPLSSASSMTSVDDASPIFDPEAITRRKVAEDLAVYPRVDDATQRKIALKYRELEKRIEQEGLYECNYWAYGRECLRYSMLLAVCIWGLSSGWYMTAAVALGCFWHQLVFSAHDAGHIAITHNYQVDSCIGIFIADFLGGLSIGWWKRNHNVHHIVTNDPEHDPDIEHLPFFAISHRFFGNLFSTYYERILPYDAFARVVVPLQHYLYYPILCFGRFNLYRLSWEHLILGKGPRKGEAAWHRWLEIVGQVFFWIWFGYFLVYKTLPTNWDRFVFVMISHVVTMPLHVQITLSHFSMSTADLGLKESFAQKMLRTSMDVDCPEWLDFFHGGLQFQAIHHLYPRIPRHNLRRTQKLVIEFCKEVGIPYAIYGFYDGNKEIIGRLEEVAKQARIMAACQASMTQKGEYGSF
ncbi:fatty acid/sphingolipid desaturase [Ascodesmis nigricans]|uniref:Delta 8-(E)-sphingolipid desaturase n=1 Tax=Ascodesmis nigricans TaxID=341454 RepID=A0A4S2MX10_9PEZI|nr:fatty acid/sphingolipid desaturase [Ascodesmis nigricans]